MSHLLSMQRQRGWNVKTNQRLASTPLFSPRVGFRWDIKKDRRFILRGGAGVFTGRIPFVWISNNYANTGIQISSFNVNSPTGLDLLLDPNGQEANANKLKAIRKSELSMFTIVTSSMHRTFVSTLVLTLMFWELTGQLRLSTQRH